MWAISNGPYSYGLLQAKTVMLIDVGHHYLVMADIVMADIVMADIVMACCRRRL